LQQFIEFNQNSRKQSMVYQCTGCEALTLQPLAIRKRIPEKPNSIKYGIPTGPFVPINCEHCGHKHHVSSSSYREFFISNLQIRWVAQFTPSESMTSNSFKL
jgi:DNA-directed RNA polymerase subunit RPC12/RpoP